MLKSKTMQSLLGIFILAAVVFALMNMWYVPTLGKFSCSYEPAFVAQAHAAEDEPCQTSLRGAANDAGWAADRMAELDDEKVTTGLAYDEDGQRHRFVSGRDDDEKLVRKLLQDIGFKADPTGRHPAATHVEAKLAAWMREGDVRTVVLVINNTKGPCVGAAQTCDAVVNALLPAGAAIYVWYPGAQSPTKLTGGAG
jgi:hypothetical protein